MTNGLPVGSVRTGFLFDGNETTPEVAVTLRHDADGVFLSVPWSSGASPYSRWFNDPWNYDGSGSEGARGVPSELLFQDPHGMVALVGCRESGHARQLASQGFGVGHIRVSHAIIGGRVLGYGQVNGLVSELEGLGSWMGLRSIRPRFPLGTSQDAEDVVTATVEVRTPPPTRLGRAMNLRAVPTFTIGRSKTDADVVEVRETMLLETLVRSRRPWQEHLEAHRSVRDLVSVAGWRLARFRDHSVALDSDGDILDGKTHRRWQPVETVLTKNQPAALAEAEPVNYLFTFSDIGPAGVGRWIALRRQFSRGVDPMISLLLQDRLAPLGDLTQAGIAIEALGFQLALEDGESRKNAREESFETRAQRVVDALDILPSTVDRTAWPSEIAAVYNSAKHANRAAPDMGDVLNRGREAKLIFRLWVASRVGAATGTVERNLRIDSAAWPWVRTD